MRGARASRWLSGWGGEALSLAGGLALPLAFAPFGVFALAVLSIGAVFLAWSHAPDPRRAGLRGWLFGAGAFGAGVSWIHESFAFSNVPGAFAVVLTVGFVAFLAAYPGVLGYLLARLVGPSPARLLVAYPCAWILVEWIRGRFLTGFTWLQLGYSQIDSPLAGWFPVLGVYGVGAVVALSGAAVAAVVVHPGRRIVLAPMAMAMVWGIGALLATQSWTVPAGAPMDVAIAQGNIPQDQKWRPEMRQPTIDRYFEMTRAHRGVDLVVWPETALPGLYHDMREVVRALAAEATANGSAVLFGVPMLEARSRQFLNSLVLVGEGTGFYHKRHLVPFGEYLPFAPMLRPVVDALGIRVADFSAGAAEQPLLHVRGHAIGVSICYEIAFADAVARDLPEAALLVTVSNDAWFGDSMGPHQHLDIARARALETGRYLVRATNTGISAVVGPDGDVVARLPQFEVGSMAASVVPLGGATPFVWLGSGPVLAVLALALAVVAGRAWKRRAAD